MTTKVHGTVEEQPKEAFESDVLTVNLAAPLPLVSVVPYVVLLGCNWPSICSCSGASPAQPLGPP